MAESNGLLTGFLPLCGKPVHVAFDGGQLTSDGGVDHRIDEYHAYLMSCDCSPMRPKCPVWLKGGNNGRG